MPKVCRLQPASNADVTQVWHFTTEAGFQTEEGSKCKLKIISHFFWAPLEYSQSHNQGGLTVVHIGAKRAARRIIIIISFYQNIWDVFVMYLFKLDWVGVRTHPLQMDLTLMWFVQRALLCTCSAFQAQLVLVLYCTVCILCCTSTCAFQAQLVLACTVCIVCCTSTCAPNLLSFLNLPLCRQISGITCKLHKSFVKGISIVTIARFYFTKDEWYTFCVKITFIIRVVSKWVQFELVFFWHESFKVQFKANFVIFWTLFFVRTRW